MDDVRTFSKSKTILIVFFFVSSTTEGDFWNSGIGYFHPIIYD
jgi:hypothetical protein